MDLIKSVHANRSSDNGNTQELILIYLSEKLLPDTTENVSSAGNGWRLWCGLFIKTIDKSCPRYTEVIQIVGSRKLVIF